MDRMLGTIAAAVAVFAGTNIDDIIVLTVLFLTLRASGNPRPWQIVAGQYGGITVLVVASALAALGLTIVPDRWVAVTIAYGADATALIAVLTPAGQVLHLTTPPAWALAAVAATIVAAVGAAVVIGRLLRLPKRL